MFITATTGLSGRPTRYQPLARRGSALTRPCARAVDETGESLETLSGDTHGRSRGPRGTAFVRIREGKKDRLIVEDSFAFFSFAQQLRGSGASEYAAGSLGTAFSSGADKEGAAKDRFIMEGKR